MTKLKRAWQHVQARKERVPPPRPTIAGTYETGKAWLEPMLREHGFTEADIDTMAEIDTRNADATLGNILRLIAKDQMSMVMALRTMHAAGLTNGIALMIEWERGGE